jgi:hypothetical protein
MFRSRALFALLVAMAVNLASRRAVSQAPESDWSFAVSGDSRNCGDFVMPAIASKVRAEKDAFYWHLGDFRWMSSPDQDLVAMLPAGTKLTKSEYLARAWDDFLARQLAAFATTLVFLGRGNHETVDRSRDDYIAKFRSYLTRPEIETRRKADGDQSAPLETWYHWTESGVDFITLDNAGHDEFSEAQLKWLRAVLDRDLDPHSAIHTIVAGMHEALPHSTSSNHAMDDWEAGRRTGELVYTWFHDAESAGKHVYIIASHSHYYSPNVFNTPYWRQHSPSIVPGWIIGGAGAHRYRLPKIADRDARTDIYGYMRGKVHSDGTIEFTLHVLSEDDLKQSRWPDAPLGAIHECFVDNSDDAEWKSDWSDFPPIL